MDSRKIAFRVAVLGLRKLLFQFRTWLLLGMLAVLTADAADLVKPFCDSVEYRVTPWFYTFLLRDSRYYGLMLLLGLVFLFCDAPFLDAGQTLAISRCGRKNWCRGQLLYILFATGLYLLAGFLMLCLMLGPYLTMQTGWGKVLTTLAHSQGSIYTGSLSFPLQAVKVLPGMAATAWAFVLHWLAGTLLGMVMFFVNLRWQRKAGAMVGTAFVLLRAFVQFLGGSWMGKRVACFSPFSWIQPERWSSVLSAACAAAALLILLLLVFAACQKTVLTSDLQTMNEIGGE